jgi:hypothetical protein
MILLLVVRDPKAQSQKPLKSACVHGSLWLRKCWIARGGVSIMLHQMPLSDQESGWQRATARPKQEARSNDPELDKTSQSKYYLGQAK